MRNPLSDTIVTIKPSGIRKFFDIVSEMEDAISLGVGEPDFDIVSEMKDAISLGVGEPDFDTPWHIREEGIYSLEKGRTFYTSNAGLKQLREEIAHYLRRRYQVSYDPLHEIMITVGGSEAIDIALRAMVNPGDEVLIPQPSYVSYVPCTMLAGGKPVVIELEEKDNFKLTPEKLLEKIADKTKILVMPFPNNPTGEAIKKADLQAWVDFANKNGAVIIYDAAYEAYITEEGIPHSIYECEGAKTCAIELRSFSKKAGFTGMRLGFAVIPKDLKSGDVSLNAMWMRRQGSKYNGTPYIIQRAGEAVYSPEGKAQVAEQIARYMKNAKTIYTGLKDAGFTVYGGVNSPYIWLKTPNDMKSWDFFDFLLNNAGIVGTPGAGFGPSGEGYFRITAFGTYENSLKALDRIKNL